MNEQQLIKQVIKGDASSFDYFVDTYQDMAMTIAYRLLGNRQDAEDAVQNAFVKAFFNLHTYQSNSKFSTWLYRIVYNTSLTAYNRIKNRKENYNVEKNEMEPIFTEANSNELSEKHDQRERINSAIQQLPKSEAVIITFYYLEEHSVQEIANIMSLTKSNVKVKLFRGRKKLQEILK